MNSSILGDFFGGLTGDVNGEIIGGGMSTSTMILDTLFTETVSSTVSMTSLCSKIDGDSMISGTLDTSMDGDEILSVGDEAGGEEFLFFSRCSSSLRASLPRSLGDFFFFTGP